MMFIDTAPNFSTQADLPHLLPYSCLLPNPADPAQVLHQVPQLRSFLPALQLISRLLLGPSYSSPNSKALPHCIQLFHPTRSTPYPWLGPKVTSYTLPSSLWSTWFCYIQPLGLTAPNTISSSPTCSVHIRFITNQRNPHVQIPLQKYQRCESAS